jgi:hypothetical protein
MVGVPARGKSYITKKFVSQKGHANNKQTCTIFELVPVLSFPRLIQGGNIKHEFLM